MESERVVLECFIAVTFAFLTALLITIDWAAANGRLRRNRFVGFALRRQCAVTRHGQLATVRHCA